MMIPLSTLGGSEDEDEGKSAVKIQEGPVQVTLDLTGAHPDPSGEILPEGGVSTDTGSVGEQPQSPVTGDCSSKIAKINFQGVCKGAAVWYYPWGARRSRVRAPVA